MYWELKPRFLEVSSQNLQHPDVDALLLDDTLVTRQAAVDFFRARAWCLASDVYVMIAPPSSPDEAPKVILKGPAGSHALRLPQLAEVVLRGERVAWAGEGSLTQPAEALEWTELLLRGLIVEMEAA